MIRKLAQVATGAVFETPRAFLLSVLFLWAGPLGTTHALAAEAEASASELILLRTGSGPAFVSINVPLVIPLTTPLPLLEFDFGFATDEPEALGRFLDSASVTLQTTDQTATALVLAADASGISWAPPNPGGLTLNGDLITRVIAPFVQITTRLAREIAYSISWPVPLEFAGRAATLYLDLLENLDAVGSLAYLRSVHVRPGAMTNIVRGIAVQSSASANGPYADEDETLSDVTARTFTLSKTGRHRFFQVVSDSRVVIRAFRVTAGNYLFDYEFPASEIVLQFAARVTGPFADDLGAAVDATNKTITITVDGDARFYRIRSNIRARIVRSERVGGRLVLHYVYEPALLKLHSSTQVRGPYAPEDSATFDPGRQVITLSRINTARFYRIRAETARRITGLRSAGENLILSYD
jgi:hypothetical protein